MAGAGYKLFNTGDVLLASEVNTYLMQQTVMVFADATARTTALSGVLAEGMVSYLQDTNVVEIYNGSAWASLDDPNAIQNSIVDAKGDIITATADNVPARLAVGTDGYTLVADSSTSTGLKWAAAAGGGKVLQVVQATYSTQATSTSSTYADTGLSATITPASASNKVLVFFTMPGGKTPGASSSAAQYNIVRTSTNVWETNGVWYTNTDINNFGICTAIYLDSPSTTSATTYKIQFRNSAGNFGNIYAQENNKTSILILAEIGA